MNKQPTKECAVCSSLITKRQNWSAKAWNDRVKYCSLHCKYLAQKGRVIGLETRAKMSLSHMGKNKKKGRKQTMEHRKHVSESKKGEKHWNWKGGITRINRAIRNSFEYKLWRQEVFKRDRWTCQSCGHKGKEIHADHIKPFALYPELRLAVDNGRTLCVPCHRETPTYSGRGFKRQERISLTPN